MGSPIAVLFAALLIFFIDATSGVILATMRQTRLTMCSLGPEQGPGMSFASRRGMRQTRLTMCSLGPEQGPPATDSVPRVPRLNLLASRGPLLGAVFVSGLVLSENMPGNMRARAGTKYPIAGEERIMSPKAHGTSATAVQSSLRWGVDVALADRICNYNRDWAENWGYFTRSSLVASLQDPKTTTPVTFYDSVTGAPLFRAPVGRTVQQFIDESLSHGWPSFRDEEVVWDNVRCLKDGETVSLTGTHLGHNLPDRGGNRYCINLVSIAALPPKNS